ncbi:MAG: glycosyltransferase [Bacilli bacterium]|nr:glycosyltransferase [Bacilli bacterium]
MRISIIGPIKQNAKEGKTNPKIFIYQSAFEKLGYETKLFSTSLSKIKVFKLLSNIKQALRYGDSIVLMLGGNACRKLLKLILFFNKKRKKRLILCPFGTGPLNPILSGKSPELVNDFIMERNFHGIKDERMKKTLSKIDCVVAQNDILKRCFVEFYELNNVKVLPNFRMHSEMKEISKNYKERSIVFISRVVKEKGILDLIKVVSEINSDKKDEEKIHLCIYGEKHLNSEEDALFNSLLSDTIKYYGPIPNELVPQTISNYAFSCLPTKHNGEGTPGFIVESLIAGVPVIASSYSQVSSILTDGYDGIIFKLGDYNDLKAKLCNALADKLVIDQYHKNAFESGQKYLFENNKNIIKEIIEGKKAL